MTDPKLATVSKSEWDRRQDELFYHVVAILARRIGQRAQSVIDVGAGNAEVLTWMPHIPVRVALDKRSSYVAEGIIPVIADLMQWTPDRKYDLALCLQTLDKFKSPANAAKKLGALGRTVIVSVTESPESSTQLSQWFGREPNFTYRCPEITSDMVRTVAVFDSTGFAWTNTAERSKKRKG